MSCLIQKIKNDIRSNAEVRVGYSILIMGFDILNFDSKKDLTEV